MNSPVAGSGRYVLFVFTHDLRLGDHAGLAAAARHGAVVPVLIIDSAITARLRRSPRRAAFYCAAVAALDGMLRAAGSRLIVRRGASGPHLRSLARSVKAEVVVWSTCYDGLGLERERDAASVLEEAGLRVLAVHDAPVVAPDDAALVLPTGAGYRSFVPYLARWRSRIPVPAAGRGPAFAAPAVANEPLPQPAEFGAEDDAAPEASEAGAATRWARFLERSILGYAIARNVPAVESTAHLSAHLAFGTIAARTVVRDVCARLADPFLLTEERTSLQLFLRAVAQRDFFLQLSWHSEALGEAALQPKMRAFRFARTHRLLDAWRHGRTGYPIVDAGIRQLHATGWMHPRVRAVAGSFLCFDLGVDWRVGRDEWDRWLIEDTPALATGNWQWIAGVGADLAAYPRIYNPLKQARRFDPAATYVRRWIPELALETDDAILHPFARRAARQLQFDLFGSPGYPAPVLEHEAAARAFLTRYVRETGSQSIGL